MAKMPEDGPFLVEIHRTTPSNSSRAAYDTLYSVASLSQIESFYRWFLDQAHLPGQGRLLDVSCGAGEMVRLACRRGFQATGIDISQVVARVARRNVGGAARIGVAAGENLPFADETFDYLTNSGSLEHFVDPAQGVREMARVLRPGGQACVLLPNTFSLLGNIWDAYRKGVTAADDQPIQRYGARMDWVRLLEANGLRVRRVVKYERAWPGYAADWSYYLHRPKEFLRLLLAPFVPFNLAACFLFVCERPRV